MGTTVRTSLQVEKRDTFCVTDRRTGRQTEELGILVVGCSSRLHSLDISFNQLSSVDSNLLASALPYIDQVSPLLLFSPEKYFPRWTWREPTCPEINLSGWFGKWAAFKAVFWWKAGGGWKSWISPSTTCRLFHLPCWRGLSATLNRWFYIARW